MPDPFGLGEEAPSLPPAKIVDGDAFRHLHKQPDDVQDNSAPSVETEGNMGKPVSEGTHDLPEEDKELE